MRSFNYDMYKWIIDLFHLPRSITGKGTIDTLNYLKKINKNLKIISFNSGEKVFDWTIPLEWEIKDSYIEHLKTKKKFAKFSDSNLHIVNYSQSKNSILDLNILKKNIFTNIKRPNDIPYITSYYDKNWGFCMSEKQKKNLPKGKYKAFINSKFKKGKLNLGEIFIKGKSSKEIFFSTYICHPSLANNELSGPVLSSAIANYIVKNYKKSEFSYRFVFLPETIGAIAYLSKKIKILKKNVICGFVLSCVGDERRYSIINSREGNTLADIALKASLIGKKKVINYSYLKRGSDERQYCSPNVNLPVCGFSRSKYGTFPEYHTSADNLNLVSQKGLNQSFEIIKNIVDAFELSYIPKNNHFGEPQLSKKKLYPGINAFNGKFKPLTTSEEMFIRMNTIAYSDNKNSIFDIAIKINKPLKKIIDEILILKKAKILS